MAVPQSRTRAPHVRRAAGYAVAARVFAVPELLENILDHLPMTDLFFAQDTCKHWKRVIAASTLLKRTLHLVPMQPTSFWSMQKFHVVPSGVNNIHDLFLERLTKNASGSESKTGLDGKVYIGAKFNPLLLTTSTQYVDLLDLWQCPCPTFLAGRIQHNVVFSLCEHSIKSLKGARNMFLTQPPCYQLDLEIEDFSAMRWYNEKKSVVICNTGGIKVGDLLSGTRRLAANKPSTLLIGFDNTFFPTTEEEEAGVIPKNWVKAFGRM
ncbi:hypothetical protein AC579_4512 [Pseudocercospora musae]|uniref:F-box domain-containing protein n=1 Tax=Pseudocercospora musae TaxID=113226 RepID=A0A139IDD0_9PEZI|nr:hypothetical protein AC579_4512 [Pseudocercospora musae]